MTEQRASAIQFAHDNSARFLNELKDFTTIASISTEEAHKADILRAAEWIANHMRSLSIENVQIFPTPGHPVVYGEWLKAGVSAPTVLIYGHYDVQPVDPLNLW